MSASEAMAWGKPLVVTDARGLAHLIDDPEGGRKARPHGATALGDALLEILMSPRLCEAKGKHNREQAVEKYDWKVVIGSLERIYEKALSTVV